MSGDKRLSSQENDNGPHNHDNGDESYDYAEGESLVGIPVN